MAFFGQKCIEFTHKPVSVASNTDVKPDIVDKKKKKKAKKKSTLVFYGKEHETQLFFYWPDINI